MKYLFSLLITIGLSGTTKAVPAKRALLIGIANYEAARLGWPNTPADRDLVLMRKTLLEQGFQKENISVLANEKAKFEGIKRRMELFIQSLRPGDKVVILFSGHGQQVPDDNGDEIEDEGREKFDEAFVPFDAPAESTRGEKHIRDDQFGLWIAQIRKQIGSKGHLLLLMDSCFSGTINRGEGSVRGGKPPIQSTVPRKPTQPSTGNGEPGSGYLDKKAIQPLGQGIGKFILMTACLPNQLNHDIVDDDGKPIGALTYAVSRAFRQLERNDTYIRMFAKATAYIDPNVQNPTMEGDTTQIVLAGNFNAYQPTFSLTTIKNLGGQMVEVAAGFVSGVFKQTKMAFYPKAGTARGKLPMATGHVVKASLTSSWIKIDSGQLSSSPSMLKAVELEKAFGNWRIKVALSPRLPASIRSALQQTLRKRSTVTLAEKGELRIESSGKYLLLRHTETLAPYDSIASDDPEAVNFCVDRITDYGQAKLIRTLSFTNSHYAIRAEFIPVEVHRVAPDSMRVDTLNIPAKSSTPYFPLNIQGQLTLYNDGDRDVYITLIDIPPDSRIKILLPDEDQPDGLLIKAGQTSKPIYFTFDKPLGTELYKIIATQKPLNLQTAIDNRGSELSPETDDPFTILLGNTYRGEAPNPIPPDEISTTTVIFIVGPER